MPHQVLLPNDDTAGGAQPTVHPLLYSIPNARRRAGNIGNTKAYELIAAGKWKAVKLDGRTFVTADSLDAHIASLPPADIGVGQTRTPPEKNANYAQGAAGVSGPVGGRRRSDPLPEPELQSLARSATRPPHELTRTKRNRGNPPVTPAT